MYKNKIYKNKTDAKRLIKYDILIYLLTDSNASRIWHRNFFKILNMKVVIKMWTLKIKFFMSYFLVAKPRK